MFLWKKIDMILIYTQTSFYNYRIEQHSLTSISNFQPNPQPSSIPKYIIIQFNQQRLTTKQQFNSTTGSPFIPNTFQIIPKIIRTRQPTLSPLSSSFPSTHGKRSPLKQPINLTLHILQTIPDVPFRILSSFW